MQEPTPLSRPAWFEHAVAEPYETDAVDIAGCRIVYQTWGTPSKPAIILVHGNGAHAHWWDFIAPFFCDTHYVVALNLSGMGDSGHRESYRPEEFVAEIVGVGEAAGIVGKPIIVGHSFGGFMTLLAGSLHADDLSGIVMVDAPIRTPHAERTRKWRAPSGRKRTYPDFDSALARFRLMPDQPCENAYILDYIGRHSLMETVDGWTWKFDATAFADGAFRVSYREHLRNLQCRIAIMWGSDSTLFLPEYAAHMADLTDHKAPMIEIPESYHHLMLDQPLAFVAAVRTLLADWGHSDPHRFAPKDAAAPLIEIGSEARDGEDAA